LGLPGNAGELVMTLCLHQPGPFCQLFFSIWLGFLGFSHAHHPKAPFLPSTAPIIAKVFAAAPFTPTGSEIV